MLTQIIKRGYSVFQDVHKLGECYRVFEPGFNAGSLGAGNCVSDFEPIDHLAHLQLLFANEPYFGRELRYFNSAPWWYKVEFDVPENAPKHTVLRVGAVDYYADVYLNGVKIGSHEGYFSPFEFNVDHCIKRGEKNTVVIKVLSPWDDEVYENEVPVRCWGILRQMIKGTYEHADTFLQRDVNPVGLLKPVELDFYNKARITGVSYYTEIEGNNGRLRAHADMDGRLDGANSRLRLVLREKLSGRVVGRTESDDCDFELSVPNVRLWECYERGESFLYTAELELIEDGRLEQAVTRNIGFRKITLSRTNDRMEYYLNDRRIFIRGTSYFPDVYTSSVDERSYRHDLLLMRAAGINAIRVHVHVESPELYDLCDEMGMLVIQDTDLNWVHPRTEEFTNRVLKVFGEMTDMLHHHPCLITWVLFNEPDRSHDDFYMTVRPGPQLEALAKQRTPDIPTIRGSSIESELHSGDSHNYRGSIYDSESHYLEKRGVSEKLNTEFGFDAPASLVNLLKIPRICSKIGMNQEEIDMIDEYQYRLTKYYIEDYRIHKYNVCSGYMQFLFSDPLPQSFFGAIDWWGSPKGAYRAMLESNQSYCVILEHDTKSYALWAVNDTLDSSKATLTVTITDNEGTQILNETQSVSLEPDSATRICDFDIKLDNCTVLLELKDKDGKLLAMNKYIDPLHHPVRPKNHPAYTYNEFSMRLYR